METLRKSIIFIPPFSVETDNIRSLISELPEKEEFYIQCPDEFININQLIMEGSSSLIISSCPKTCSLILNIYQKLVSQNKLNVLLVSSYEIPEKILKKIQLLGPLDYFGKGAKTELIIERILVLIRSLQSQTETNSIDANSQNQKESNNGPIILQSEVAYGETIDYRRLKEEFDLNQEDDYEEETNEEEENIGFTEKM